MHHPRLEGRGGARELLAADGGCGEAGVKARYARVPGTLRLVLERCYFPAVDIVRL
jgi:hypothetical protein